MLGSLVDVELVVRRARFRAVGLIIKGMWDKRGHMGRV